MTDAPDLEWDVFISYAGPDEAIAAQLHRALDQRGKRAYFHPASSQPGDEWRTMIPGHIERATVTAVLLSEHSAAAWYQDSEITIAVDTSRTHGSRVVPIRLAAKAQLPFGLERAQAIDAWHPTGIAEAADKIAAVIDRPEDHPSPSLRAIVSDRIPHVNRWLTGRQALLKRLASSWQERRDQPEVLILHGMGGAGKSTLAAALARRVEEHADVLWWIRAEQEATLIDDIIELADRLDIAPIDDRRERARRTIRFLAESERRWLLVFDNVDDERIVAPWIPAIGRGSSVITTRDRTVRQLGETVSVGILSPEEATEFLVRRTSVTPGQAVDRAGAAAVAELLEGHPLALEQAGAWVAASERRTFARFADRFAGARKNPFPDGTVPVDYERTTWACIQVSVDAASTVTPVAERLWHVLGWLASDDIAIEWFTGEAGDGYLDIEDEDELEEAIEALEMHSLVMADGDTISDVHRVVQAAARQASPPEAGRTAVRLLYDVHLEDGYKPETWAINRRLLPHARAARHHGAGLPESASELSAVLDSCASTVQFAGDPLAAMHMFEANVEFTTDYLGPRHDGTIVARGNLVAAYGASGRIADAIEVAEAVLVDEIELLGERHKQTLMTRSNLCWLHAHAGRVDEAVRLSEQVVEVQTEELGESDEETLITKGNLVSYYRLAGRTDAAIRLGEEVFEARRAVLGDRNPFTLASRFALSLAYSSAGRLTDAISVCEDVLATQSAVLGDRHPDTLRSMAHLGDISLAAGHHEDAIRLARDAHDGQVAVIGPTHPDTLKSKATMAAANRAAGRFYEAIRLDEEVLRKRIAELGELHPSTVRSRASLAVSLRAADRCDEAEAALREAIEGAASLDHELPDLTAWRDVLADWTAAG